MKRRKKGGRKWRGGRGGKEEMERKKKGGRKMEGRRGEERKEGRGGEGEERENYYIRIKYR